VINPYDLLGTPRQLTRQPFPAAGFGHDDQSAMTLAHQSNWRGLQGTRDLCFSQNRRL